MAKNKQPKASAPSLQQGKKAKALEPPHRGKSPAAAARPPRGDGPFRLHFSGVDHEGPFAWPWGVLHERGELASVLKKLEELADMNTSELRAQGSHFIEAENLAKDARERLEVIEKDDLDGLFSFRLQGRPRVFCEHRGEVMKVLWWDPEHQVCPSTLKHT